MDTLRGEKGFGTRFQAAEGGTATPGRMRGRAPLAEKTALS
jgi:hypothetical protein